MFQGGIRFVCVCRWFYWHRTLCKTWLFYFWEWDLIGWKCFPIISKWKAVQLRDKWHGAPVMVRRALTGTSGCVVLRGNNRIPDSFLTASQWPIFRRNARVETSEAVPAHESQLCVFAMLPCFFCVWVNCGSGGIPAPPRTCIHAWSIFFSCLVAFSVSVCFCHFLTTKPDLLCTTTSQLCSIWKCCWL